MYPLHTWSGYTEDLLDNRLISTIQIRTGSSAGQESRRRSLDLNRNELKTYLRTKRNQTPKENDFELALIDQVFSDNLDKEEMGDLHQIGDRHVKVDHLGIEIGM